MAQTISLFYVECVKWVSRFGSLMKISILVNKMFNFVSNICNLVFYKVRIDIQMLDLLQFHPFKINVAVIIQRCERGVHDIV